MRALAIDLFCGLGGWAEGLLAEGFEVVGFDIERHEYAAPDIEPDESGRKGTRPVAKRGWTQGCAVSLGMEGASARARTKLLRYPAQLIVQDVLTLHGSQFRDAALIVASPPCQFFSYTAMPWSRAKKLAAEVRADPARLEKELALFNACFRIQREACEAAGRHIPMVVENVRGAIPWVGRSRWNFGSFHLWGDVPALMPVGRKFKSTGMNWSDRSKCGQDFTRIAGQQAMEGHKVPGFRFDGRGGSFQTASVEGVKQHGSGREWFAGDGKISRMTGSKSPARKAASAMIAKIPFALSRHIATTFKPAGALG